MSSFLLRVMKENRPALIVNTLCWIVRGSQLMKEYVIKEKDNIFYLKEVLKVWR